jgi:4-hydroxybutyrate dehydrogenase
MSPLTPPDLSAITVLQFNTQVHFGCGARARLADLAARAGLRRPLVVSDAGVAAAGVLDRALAAAPVAAQAPRFLDTPPNPTEAASRDGAALYRREGCDGIVGVGGGAALDLAKAIAILATDDAPLWDFCNRHARPRPIVGPAPLILMPTTSGSGSEVGRSAVIVFDNGIKAGVGCPSIVTAAIDDPELTAGLPGRITAVTGLDALSHCVETFCSPTVNPPADAIALDGLSRAFGALEPATRNGGDIGARWQMMMASLEGAVCFQKGMGAVHALSHPIGALGHHHGTLNGIFLPHVLRHNAQALGAKLDAMRGAMALAPDADVAEAFDTLNARLGVARRLSELGLTRDDLAAIPEKALEDNAHKTNPRPLHAADYRLLLDQAF